MHKEEIIKGLSKIGFDYDTATIVCNNSKLSTLYENLIETENKLKEQKKELSDKESRWSKYGKDLAIRELEKVRELTNKNYLFYDMMPKSVLRDTIDQQIKELQ